MCGISGILAYAAKVHVTNDELTRFNVAMQHRGPDGSGTWLSNNHKIGLAHRRLSIIDLTESASQPMSDKQKTVYVTYNGEIYNHLILRTELEALGYIFQTNGSDTEVLVHGYKEWGIDGLVKRIIGMFAFAIWDAKTQTLFVVRDRIGVKPVYFTRAAGRFLFASEIKAILTDTSVPREVNGTAITHYLSFMVSPAPLTMFRGIFKLPAGHILEIKANGKAKGRRYWDATPGKSDLKTKIKGMSLDNARKVISAEILQRLEVAIDRRMMSDVPYGVFLSGGIDSSANVALMTKISNQPVKTFTVGFSDHTHLNELDYANKVATHFNTDHHIVQINEKDMRNYLGALIESQDEPLSDWVCVPLYFLSKLAKDSGVTVVQVGEGSDEQFAGYDSYIKYLRLNDKLNSGALKNILGASSPLLGVLARIFPGRRSMFEQIYEVSRRICNNHELFYGGANAFWSIHLDQFLNDSALAAEPADIQTQVEGLEFEGGNSRDSGDLIDAFAHAINESVVDCDQLAKMIHAEFRLRLPELLLMRVDKITMSTSVEARVPFLDHELVEFTMDIPANLKVNGYETKHLLKNVLRGTIPDSIIDRKKMGFAAPVADWLKGDFGHEAESLVLGSPLCRNGPLCSDAIRTAFDRHRNFKEDNALHLWVLLNLTALHDHWIAGHAIQ